MWTRSKIINNHITENSFRMLYRDKITISLTHNATVYFIESYYYFKGQ